MEKFTAVKMLVDGELYSIEQIAVKTGASASTVWTWYRGRRPRNRVYVKKLIALIKKGEAKKNGGSTETR